MRRFLKWFLIVIVLVVCLIYGYGYYRSFRTPGSSYSGQLDPLDNFQSRVRDHLKEHVNTLAGQIGERNVPHYDKLEAAASYIRNYLQQNDYQVKEDDYSVNGKTCRNLYVELAGSDRSRGVLVVGAHYDSVHGAPGADDNGSGVAAVLELARIMKNDALTQSILFAFFPNEEPPYSNTDNMGSLLFARGLKRDYTPITGMISIETIGYYSDRPGSQHYPTHVASFYPNTGNFIGFVSDLHSRALMHRAIEAFRSSTHFPSEGAALPSSTRGISWSDHWSFWQIGVPAIMVTDTAPFRNPYYHTANDTADKLDYDRMARVVVGLKHVVEDLTQ